LRTVGIDGIIIGSTCIDIALDRPSEEDLDLFTTSISPLIEEYKIRQLAYEHGWSTGTTELGTPSITINLGDVDITVELYENIMDFYIPEEALNLCKQSTIIDEVPLYYVAPECWVVFKARRGSSKDMADLSMVRHMVSEGMLKINKTMIENVVNLFEEDKDYIINRLRTVNIL